MCGGAKRNDDKRPAAAPAVNLDHAVDWWLNVYNELDENDDPEKDLAEVLGNTAAAERIWKGFTSMTRAEEEAFFLYALREDSEAVREWCEKWLNGW